MIDVVSDRDASPTAGLLAVLLIVAIGISLGIRIGSMSRPPTPLPPADAGTD